MVGEWEYMGIQNFAFRCVKFEMPNSLVKIYSYYFRCRDVGTGTERLRDELRVTLAISKTKITHP